MGDLSFEHTNELLALRDAQTVDTQRDNTTLLTKEIERVRNLDAVSANQDTNTKLEAAWDGVR